MIAESKKKMTDFLMFVKMMTQTFADRHHYLIDDYLIHAKDRKEWRAMVHVLLNEFHATIFAWPCVLLDRPPVLWWLSPGEWWDAVT